jgi:hypothetical protein
MTRLIGSALVSLVVCIGCEDSTTGPSSVETGDAPFRAGLTTVPARSNPNRGDNITPCPTPCPASASGTQTDNSPCCPDEGARRQPRGRFPY